MSSSGGATGGATTTIPSNGKLYEKAPLLEDADDPRQIVLHRLAIKAATKEFDWSKIVWDTLEPTATPDQVSNGKRFLLSGYDNFPKLRSLIARNGVNGPACWTWIEENMLGGRSEQTILREILDEMYYVGNEPILSFYGQFEEISEAIQPPLGATLRCEMYGQPDS